MRIVIVLLMVFVSVSGFAEWLEAEFTFQAGWIPFGNIDFFSNGKANNQHDLKNYDVYFRIDTLILSHIIVGGSLTSYFYMDTTKRATISPVTFMPTGMTFDFNLGILIVDGFSVIYQHRCAHPVIAYFQTQLNISTLDIAFDRVYFEFKGKLF